MTVTVPATDTDDAAATPSRRRSALRDGVRTFPIALAVLASWGVVVVLVPDAVDGDPTTLRVRLAGAVIAWALAALALPLVRHVLGGRVEPTRARAANVTVRWYGPVALATAAMTADGEALALVLGAVAMTAPGVLTVVLDGSDVGRAVTRVVGALALVPLAAVAGFVAGYVGWLVVGLVLVGIARVDLVSGDVPATVAFFLGAFPLGFLAGHLTTYVPLALGARRTPGAGQARS